MMRWARRLMKMKLVSVFLVLLMNMFRWAHRRIARIKKFDDTPGMIPLPHDMILEVLAKLPVKFLLRLRCVSKSWNFIVSDPHFLKLLRNSDTPSVLYYCPRDIGSLTSLSVSNEHCLFNCSGSRSSGFMPVRPYIPWEEERGVRYDSYVILSSCNGLILVESNESNSRTTRWILWNPSTRQFRNLPRCPHGSSVISSYGVGCLGYDVLTDDYKVVKCTKTEIHVFSVKSNTWAPEIITHDAKIWSSSRCEAVFLDGIFHWLSPLDKPDLRAITFDLGTEEIGEMGLPKYYQPRHFSFFGHCVFLGTLSGWLCLLFYHSHCDLEDESPMDSPIDLKIHVWVMKEYGVTSSWTKLFVVRPEITHACYPSQHNMFVPFSFSKEEDELLGIIHTGRDLVAVKFNTRNLTFEDVVRWPITFVLYCAQYMESLVPI